MKNAVAILTMAVFGLLALVLAIGGLGVIFDDGDEPNPGASKTACPEPIPCQMPAAPEIPPVPTLTETAFAPQQVTIYEHQVTAYEKRVAAYEKYLQEWSSQRGKGPNRLTRYQAVVKDALSPILTPLVTAFIAYAFAKGTANVVRNLLAARQRADLTELEL
jgi:hypothetical protein